MSNEFYKEFAELSKKIKNIIEMLECLASVPEEKEEILDEKEKEYLRAVIKPFRDRVMHIKKKTYYEKEFIEICVKDEIVSLPYFESNTMYKGMELNKGYTLEELGL